MFGVYGCALQRLTSPTKRAGDRFLSNSGEKPLSPECLSSIPIPDSLGGAPTPPGSRNNSCAGDDPNRKAKTQPSKSQKIVRRVSSGSFSTDAASCWRASRKRIRFRLLLARTPPSRYTPSPDERPWRLMSCNLRHCVGAHAFEMQQCHST